MLAHVPAKLSSAVGERDALLVAALLICARQRQEMAGMKAMIEQLQEERAGLRARLEQVSGEREQLEQSAAELRRRLGLDSTNSSKPPSSDGLKRARRTASSPERQRRKRLGRRPGKQKGAPGHHLAPVAEPTRVVELLPAFCGKCERSLAEGAEDKGMERRQVIDLPAPAGLETTEYQAHWLRCGGCGEVTKAAFPEWARALVSYGPRMHAMAGYLSAYQHTPFERMREQLHDIYDAEVSVGTLAAMVARCGERARPTVEEVRRQLQAAEVLHLDETGGHVNGRLKWVHGASTERLTLLGIDDHRGAEGIKALGVMEECRGIAIHDAWSSYWGAALEKVSGHGLCNAHHLRELAAVTELDGQQWSRRMSSLLLETLAVRNAAMEAGQSALAPELVAEYERRYDRIIKAGWREVPRRAGKRQGSKAGNLLQRLEEHREEALRFLRDFRVPFTNNQVERDLRMIKLHEKISGGWRSMEGARAFLCLRSCLGTARKQGQGMLEVLTAAVEGRPWLPAAGP